jgi:hypothetical protein
MFFLVFQNKDREGNGRKTSEWMQRAYHIGDVGRKLDNMLTGFIFI